MLYLQKKSNVERNVRLLGKTFFVDLRWILIFIKSQILFEKWNLVSRPTTKLEKRSLCKLERWNNTFRSILGIKAFELICLQPTFLVVRGIPFDVFLGFRLQQPASFAFTFPCFFVCTVLMSKCWAVGVKQICLMYLKNGMNGLNGLVKLWFMAFYGKMCVLWIFFEFELVWRVDGEGRFNLGEMCQGIKSSFIRINENCWFWLRSHLCQGSFHFKLNFHQTWSVLL